MFRKSTLYACIFIFIVILNFSTTPTFAASEKDTLVIGFQDDTASLDPAITYETSAWGILSQVYENLVNFRGDDFTQVVPELAESWEFGDDGKNWTFHLRKGVLFSTGNPVNADAVVFSLRRAIKLESNSSWVLTQFGITEESITKIDEHTVQVVLDRPSAPGLFLACLTPPIGGILDPRVVMEHEQNGDMGSAWLGEHSAGTGPFILGQQKRGEFYVLTANERYWREKPPFKQIIVKNVQEAVEQMALLEQGEIDIALNLHPDQVNILMDNPNIQIFETLKLFINFISMNVEYPPLAKPEVRDAIRYAIDYDGLIAYIFQGAAEKIQTVIPKGLLGYNPDMPYSRNLKKAKQLLTDAGYPDGFGVELKCLDYSPWIDIAIKIQRDLAELGVNVKILQRTPDQLMEESGSQKFQMYLWEWGADFPDPDAMAKAFAHCDSSGDDATIKSAAWEAKYVNLETSRLVEQAARELNQEKRIAIYKRITEIILDDGPFIVLNSPIQQYGVRLDVVNSIKFPKVIWIPFPFFERSRKE